MPNLLELAAARCGIVKYDAESLSTYHFVSSSRQNVRHTVDLSRLDWSGECSCEHFQMRILPLIRGKLIRLHSAQSKCKHIRRAEAIFCYVAKRRVIPSSESKHEQNRI